MKDFLERNEDPILWEKAVSYFKEGFSPDLDSSEQEKTFEELKEFYRQRGPDRTNFTFGQLPAPVLLLLGNTLKTSTCWSTILYAKCGANDTEGLDELYQAADKSEFNVNTALAYACTATSACNSKLKTIGGTKTAEWALKKGAQSNDRGLLTKAMCAHGYEMGRIFAINGLTRSTMQSALANVNGQELLLRKDLSRLCQEYGRYTPVDEETIMEDKDLSENSNDRGYARVRIVFNFAAGRVVETYEPKNSAHPPKIETFFFDEYGQAAIEKAESRLREMGKNPTERTPVIRSKRQPLTPRRA